MLNMNEADKQRNFDPIPDGTFLKLIMNFKAGGHTMPGGDPADANLFKASQKSDAIMLECEFTVDGGPNAHRKWSEHWVVGGGSVDEKGNSKGWNFTKQRIRAMIESAANIRPDDESPESKAARMIPNFSTLDGIPFYAKTRIEEGEDYLDETTGQTKKGFDKNLIDRIVTPDMEEYAPLVRGEAVAPKPSGGGRSKKSGAPDAGSSEAPRWKKAESPGPQSPQPSLPMGDKPAGDKPAGSGPKWLNKA